MNAMRVRDRLAWAKVMSLLSEDAQDFAMLDAKSQLKEQFQQSKRWKYDDD